MKLASFKNANAQSYGVVTDDGVVDVGRALSRYPSLRAALTADALGEIAAAAKNTAFVIRLDQLVWLPPIPDPEKIICIGLNYKAHAAESGAKIPEKPSMFLRLTNTLVPHGGAM